MHAIDPHGNTETVTHRRTRRHSEKQTTSAYVTPRRETRGRVQPLAVVLVALETTSFFRVERACGDDADRRVILDLDVNDKKKSPEQRVNPDRR